MFFSKIKFSFFGLLFIFNCVYTYPQHAQCALKWTLPHDCDKIKELMVKQMDEWNDDTNCGKVSNTCPELPCGQNCLYTYLGVDEDGTLQGKHTTPVHRYNDSISFQFKPLTGTSCQIDAFSSSDLWYARLDYGTNYCNLRNLLDGTGLSANEVFIEETSTDDCTQYDQLNCEKY